VKKKIFDHGGTYNCCSEQPLFKRTEDQLTWSVIWSWWLFSHCACASCSLKAAKKRREKYVASKSGMFAMKKMT